jgi:hypothetical protein
VRRIGVLDTLAADDPEASVRHGAFMQGLQELGWSIGRNLRIDTRWATTNAAEIRRHAAELAALAPDVILAQGAAAVGSPRQKFQGKVGQHQQTDGEEHHGPDVFDLDVLQLHLDLVARTKAPGGRLILSRSESRPRRR